MPFWSMLTCVCFAMQLRCGALHLRRWLGPLRSPTPNAVALGWASLVVGVARLELAALRSRTVRATKLRYTPLHIICFYLLSFIRCAIFMFGSARFPSGLAFSIQSGNRHRLDVKYFCLRSGLIANQTALHPVGKFDCLCNIHQFANFCNKIAPTI